jgi:hypothetical protein
MGKLRTVEGVDKGTLQRLFLRYRKSDRLDPFLKKLSQLKERNYPLEVTPDSVFVPKEHFILLNSVLVEIFRTIDQYC